MIDLMCDEDLMGYYEKLRDAASTWNDTKKLFQTIWFVRGEPNGVRYVKVGVVRHLCFVVCD